MGEKQNQAGEQEQIEEPRATISKEEIKNKRYSGGGEIDKASNYDDYKNAFDKFAFYRDLKQKLSK